MKRFIKSAIACIAAAAMIATVAPVTTQAAAKKPVVVKTQAQLEKAIKAGATNITIKTDKKVAITIPATKKAAKVAFTVNAPKASVENKTNNGKGLEIKNAASFKESGRNSAITIATKKDITVTVAKASKGADIKVTKANANLTVKANGILNSVSLEAKGAQLAIKGSSTNSIDITAKAANTTIATAVPADITVAKGASVASVEVQAAGVAVSLDVVGTVADVKVAAGAEGAKLEINASGTVGNVTVDAKADVAVAGTTEDAVKVTVNAEGASVKAETAVETTLNADAKVDLGAGAEGSSVSTGEGVKADVNNGTSEKIDVVDSTGNKTEVGAGESQTAGDAGNNNGGSTSNGGGNYNPGGSDPVVDTEQQAVDNFVNSASIYVHYDGVDTGTKINSTVVVTSGALSRSCGLTELKDYIKLVGKESNKLNSSSSTLSKTLTLANGKTRSFEITFAAVNDTETANGITKKYNVKTTSGTDQFLATVLIYSNSIQIVPTSSTTNYENLQIAVDGILLTKPAEAASN